MQVRVLLFGSLREATGVKELAVALPDGARVAELSVLLAREHAVFAALPARVKVAVNQRVVERDRELADGDEVAYLPPVSGGGGRCRILDAPVQGASSSAPFSFSPRARPCSASCRTVPARTRS